MPRTDGDSEELAGADRLPRVFGSEVDFGAGGGLGDDLCSLTEMPDDAPTGSEVFRRLVLEATPETGNNTLVALPINKEISTALWLSVTEYDLSPNTVQMMAITASDGH